MMKKSILTLVIFMCTTSAQAQQNQKFSNYRLSVEASSNFIVSSSASMSAEFRLYSSKTNGLHTYARVGFGKGSIHPIFTINDNFNEKLLGVTFLLGSGKNHFEINSGVYLLSEQEYTDTPGLLNDAPDERGNVLPIFDIGYRYQQPGGGIIFSVKFGVFGLGLGIGSAF